MIKRGSSNKSGQITIFVIVAIILVASVALIFVVKSSKLGNLSVGNNPRAYLEKCLVDAGESVIEKVAMKGGIGVVKSERSLRFNSTNITYLCYTKQYTELCTNEHPMLNKEIEKEIATLIKPGVEKCLASVKEKFIQGYSEENIAGSEWVNVSLVPKYVILGIEKRITYESSGVKSTLNGVHAQVTYPLYEFTTLANEVINQELSCNCEEETCNADTTELAYQNREFEFSKPFNIQNGEVYVLREFLTDKKFQFAIRNCVRREF